MLQERLKALRQENGWSQEALAERLNVSRQAVAKWESGSAVPELDKLMALGDLYQTTLDALVRGEQPCAGRRGAPVGGDGAELIAFLLRAAAKTYAGKGARAAVASRPGSEDFWYEEGDYRYIDAYLGGQRFMGEESLHYRGVCVWGMNYAGRTLGEGFSGDFLKAALLLRPAERPFRGPALYRDGRYTYQSAVEGDFGWFRGSEAVYCDERQVFECMYHGGWVQA